MFFVSWLLWEQMTFILGLAILAVCFIGYIKLLWTNRIVRKQEVVDEEKRMKIQALRSSGQIVEMQKSHDIPFGVRAIQSGIQVDGIWISQVNTPAASNFRLGSGTTSPDMLPSPDPRSGIVTDLRPLSQATPHQYLSDQDVVRRYDNTYSLQEASDEPNVQGAYKPRRAASNVKHGSHGEFHETTLHQLEGSSAQKKVHVHRPRHASSRQAEVEGDTSAADNELSSGVSSRSDASLSNEAPMKSTTVVSGAEFQYPGHAQNSRVEYFSVPGDSPMLETTNPFTTPPFQSPATSPTLGIPLIAFDNSEEFNRSQSQAEASYVAGDLHLNKSVRKVNSGFEVLPAGTFKGKGRKWDLEGDSEGRRQSKLQKKPRSSTAGRTASVLDE